MTGSGAASRHPASLDGEGWGRGRLLAILIGLGGVALALLVGFGYAVVLAVESAGGDLSSTRGRLGASQMTSSAALGRQHRDRVAAQPMLHVDADAMKPATPTTQLTPSIEVPAATATGAAGVATGFPHTPAGAVGQLGALTQTVLSSMSVATAHRVYEGWATPGGAGASRWVLTRNIVSFLAAAGMGSTMNPSASVAIIPAAAQVKGTDGPDWTLACVLVQVDATVTTQSEIGYGHCERMQWQHEPQAADGGRWLIAPGAAPAPAPNTWPGTALARRAGWRTWATSNPTSDPTSNPDGEPGLSAGAGATAADNPAGDGYGTDGQPTELGRGAAGSPGRPAPSEQVAEGSR